MNTLHWRAVLVRRGPLLAGFGWCSDGTGPRPAQYGWRHRRGCLTRACRIVNVANPQIAQPRYTCLPLPRGVPMQIAGLTGSDLRRETFIFPQVQRADLLRI